MRRRISGAGHTGLGNSAPHKIDGKPTGDKKFDAMVRKCSKDVYETFFKGTEMDDGYVDAQVKNGEVMIGIEPGYMYERLKIIVIAEHIGESKMITGYAWGAWGSDIRQSERRYDDLKRKAKFAKFVDRWHPLLFKQKDLFKK